jgi:hypothetical protein
VIERDPRLAAEPDLEPSSGFAASVMDAVREMAAEPPPLPFPWRRFFTGVLLCLAACMVTTLALGQPWVIAAIDMPALATAAPGVLYATAGMVFAFIVMRLARLRWL